MRVYSGLLRGSSIHEICIHLLPRAVRINSYFVWVEIRSRNVSNIDKTREGMNAMQYLCVLLMMEVLPANGLYNWPSYESLSTYSPREHTIHRLHTSFNLNVVFPDL